MRCRFAFNQTRDGRLLIIMEALWGFPAEQRDVFTVTPFDDENIFIHRVVLADISHQDTIDLIAGVLLAISGCNDEMQWVTVTLSELQLFALGIEPARHSPETVPKPSTLELTDAEDLQRALMESPVAFCMLSGPQHTISFINDKYVQLLGRNSASSLVSKPIREALTDLNGQPFFGLLDRVYSTGKPYVGVGVLGTLYHESSQSLQDHYFDFVYQPIHDNNHVVYGILCQATNVTERVLAEHVRESREAQLYRQWAELDAIYRDSPLGMCLIDANTLTFLRLNETKARILGQPVERILGKKVMDLLPGRPEVEAAYRQVIQTKSSENFEFSRTDDSGKLRTWFWNLNPVFDASGEVESIASIILEVTELPRALREIEEASLIGSCSKD